MEAHYDGSTHRPLSQLVVTLLVRAALALTGVGAVLTRLGKGAAALAILGKGAAAFAVLSVMRALLEGTALAIVV